MELKLLKMISKPSKVLRGGITIKKRENCGLLSKWGGGGQKKNYETYNRGEGVQFIARKNRQERLKVLPVIYILLSIHYLVS